MWCFARAFAWEKLWASISITKQTMENDVWYWFTLPLFAGLCWALLMLILNDNIVWYWFTSLLATICHNFLEKSTPKNYCSRSFFPLPWTWADWKSLLVSSGLNYHCWFVNGVGEWIKLPPLILVSWTAGILAMYVLPSTISKQVYILFCPINLSFQLPLIGGGLEERLKLLSTLIKVGFEKNQNIYMSLWRPGVECCFLDSECHSKVHMLKAWFLRYTTESW